MIWLIVFLLGEKWKMTIVCLFVRMSSRVALVIGNSTWAMVAHWFHFPNKQTYFADFFPHSSISAYSRSVGLFTRPTAVILTVKWSMIMANLVSSRPWSRTEREEAYSFITLFAFSTPSRGEWMDCRVKYCIDSCRPRWSQRLGLHSRVLANPVAWPWHCCLFPIAFMAPIPLFYYFFLSILISPKKI